MNARQRYGFPHRNGADLLVAVGGSNSSTCLKELARAAKQRSATRLAACSWARGAAAASTGCTHANAAAALAATAAEEMLSLTRQRSACSSSSSMQARAVQQQQQQQQEESAACQRQLAALHRLHPAAGMACDVIPAGWCPVRPGWSWELPQSCTRLPWQLWKLAPLRQQGSQASGKCASTSLLQNSSPPFVQPGAAAAGAHAQLASTSCDAMRSLITAAAAWSQAQQSAAGQLRAGGCAAAEGKQPPPATLQRLRVPAAGASGAAARPGSGLGGPWCACCCWCACGRSAAGASTSPSPTAAAAASSAEPHPAAAAGAAAATAAGAAAGAARIHRAAAAAAPEASRAAAARSPAPCMQTFWSSAPSFFRPAGGVVHARLPMLSLPQRPAARHRQAAGAAQQQLHYSARWR
ncbi:hypothetical protein COO60DRAFT_1227877 [Scenedesmus sp. NREL 46B-D3]|nr:hypothetical protein COO60DRAFT_1227877 [Scenedesmus sp. NREL 46B-D3]